MTSFRGGPRPTSRRNTPSWSGRLAARSPVPSNWLRLELIRDISTVGSPGAQTAGPLVSGGLVLLIAAEVLTMAVSHSENPGRVAGVRPNP